MGRTWQLKRMKDHFFGSHEQYMETLWFARQHLKRKEELEKRIAERDSIGNNSDGCTSHGGISNPTEQKALQIVQLEKDIAIVDDALKSIPEEYRDLVLRHVLGKAYYTAPEYDKAHVNTWSKWQQVFLWKVACLRNEEEFRSYLDLL